MEVFRSAPLKSSPTSAEPAEPKVSWRQCEDFTEDHQAMNVSRHILMVHTKSFVAPFKRSLDAMTFCNGSSCFAMRHVVQKVPFRQAQVRQRTTLDWSTTVTLVRILVGPFTPQTPFDGSAPAAFAGTDAYGNAMPMQMQLPMQPAAMSSSTSSLQSWCLEQLPHAPSSRYWP